MSAKDQVQSGQPIVHPEISPFVQWARMFARSYMAETVHQKGGKPHAEASSRGNFRPKMVRNSR